MSKNTKKTTNSKNTSIVNEKEKKKETDSVESKSSTVSSSDSSSSSSTVEQVTAKDDGSESSSEEGSSSEESSSSSSSDDSSEDESKGGDDKKDDGSSEDSSASGEEESNKDDESNKEEKKDSSSEGDSTSSEDEDSSNEKSKVLPKDEQSAGLTIFMKNFGPSITDEKIRKELEKIGSIKELRIPKKRDQNKNRGFLICCFEKSASVKKAVEFNGKTFLDCTIYVEELKEGLKSKADFKSEKQQKISERPSRSERGERAVLFVGNLPYEVDEYAFKKYIEEQGNVISIRIPQDKETGRKRGFAFFEFVDKKEMTIFQNKSLVWDERKLTMRPSEPSNSDGNKRSRDDDSFKRNFDNDRGFQKREDGGFKRRDEKDFKRRDDRDFKRRDDRDFKRRDERITDRKDGNRSFDRQKSNKGFDNGRKENFGNSKRRYDDKPAGKKVKFDDDSD